MNFWTQGSRSGTSQPDIEALGDFNVFGHEQ
jgi:hypothetical protein